MRLLLTVLLPTVFSSFLPNRIQQDAAPTTVQVCDVNNSNNSFIYCYGKILESVNYWNLYNDSKTFVDMPMVNDPEQTQTDFEAQFGSLDVKDIDPAKLRTFMSNYFTPPGSELISCTPKDWVKSPAKLATIVDPQLREWAMQLNGVWKTLCKQIDPSIEAHSSRYSLIYVPNLFIAPGGRFREFYYWDAYWIVKGLIASEMYSTTRDMIENLGSMVDRFGFVPNGGRVYYLQRSQPPLLSGMVYDYYEATNDKDFVVKMLPTLEKELEFWNNNRMINVTVNGTNYSVYHYNTASNVPRPESYSEDVRKSKDIQDKPQFYQDIASAAESGWDFSTRWFSDKKTIYHIETTKIAPIDLNSYICWNLDILEYLNERTGNFNHSEKYRDSRAAFRNTVNRVFYNATDGTWYDYNMRTGKHNVEFYPSGAVPLFTGCYNSLNQGKSSRLFKYMQDLHVFDYPGGIPTSMIQDSEEQWDFPNGWSPLNHMVIEGLRKSQSPQMQDQAFQLAKKWVLGNYKVWSETHHMWEKYNVIGDYPRPGSGGEYNVQDGFGWTNGVILDLLLTYSDRLMVPANFTGNDVTTQMPTETTPIVNTLPRRTTRSIESTTKTGSMTLTWSLIALLVVGLM